MTIQLQKGDVCSLEVVVQAVLEDRAVVGIAECDDPYTVPQDYLTLIRRAPVDLATCEIPKEGIPVLDAHGRGWVMVARHDIRAAVYASPPDGGHSWLKLSDLRPLDVPAPDKGMAFDVRAYVDEYEFRGDGGDYTPTEGDKAMLEDFGEGLISEFVRGLIPNAPAPESEVERLRARVAQQAAGMATAHIALLGGTKREVVAEYLSKAIVRDEAIAPTCPPGHIMIGDRAVPEPMREVPRMGQVYWSVSPSLNIIVHFHKWDGRYEDNLLLSRGLIHSTEANARAHAEAIIAMSARGDA